jgi:hypothetical protein
VADSVKLMRIGITILTLAAIVVVFLFAARAGFNSNTLALLLHVYTVVPIVTSSQPVIVPAEGEVFFVPGTVEV